MANHIVICGSMSSIENMKMLTASLINTGYKVTIPKEADIDWDTLTESDCLDTKKQFIDDHLANIAQADTLLIANFPKNGQTGYIGANVMMEIAFGYALGKPIFLLFEPMMESNRLEVLSVATRILNGDIDGVFGKTGIRGV